MKYYFALVLVGLVGCTHAKLETASTASVAGREPASLLYQGPFVVSLDGNARTGKSYLPLQYDAAKSWPLVILLHGFTGTADQEDSYLTMRYRVSLRGFLLLEPEGTLTPKGTLSKDGKDMGGFPFWNATDACCDFGKTGVDDVGYVTGLIEQMKKKYNVDPKRIYVFGHSNGAFMANRLACESGETFAGIASLAGGTYKDPKNCAKPVPVNYLEIHATDDKTILYEKAPEYAGGKDAVGQWVERNGCSGSPTVGAPRNFVFLIPGNDTTDQEWKHCKSGKDVALWTIKDFTAKGHNPHVPLFHLNFTEAVLDFLFQYSN